MKKSTSPSKKINWESLKDKKIHKFITIGEFLYRLQEDPTAIHDYDIRYAIERLQDACINGTEAEAREARSILKAAKLEFFIPKAATYRHKQSMTYRLWEKIPDIMISAVTQLETRMRPAWKKHQMSERARAEKALERLFVSSPKMPSLMSGTLKELMQKLEALPRGKEGKAEYGRGLTNLAVACFMVAFNIRDVRVVTFRDFYGKIKKRYRPKPKEKLTDEKRFSGPIVDPLTKIVTDEGLHKAKFVYNQAYEIYKLSFFFDEFM